MKFVESIELGLTNFSEGYITTAIKPFLVLNNKLPN